MHRLGRDDPPCWPNVANNGGEDDVARQLIKIYYCPTRRAPTGYGTLLSGRCDYAGNAGIFQGNVHELTGDTPPAPLGIDPMQNERTAFNFGNFGGRGGFIVWPRRGAKRTRHRSVFVPSPATNAKASSMGCSPRLPSATI